MISGKYMNLKINSIPFKAKVTKQRRLTKSGSICKWGIITIPHKISSYLKLKNKQEVEIENVI